MTFPAPIPDSSTEAYWAAVRDRRLSLPRCTACSRFHFYPREICPHCGSDKLEWADVSGRATVYSFTIVYRAPSPAFADKVPYVVATVQLAEGPLMMTNLVGIEPDQAKIGMPVKVTFEERGEGVLLPMFAPAA